MPPTIYPLGDEALLVRFGTAMSPEARNGVMGLMLSLRREALPSVLDYTAAYASVLIRFDPCQCSPTWLTRALEERIETLEPGNVEAPRKLEIPVCYGGSFGPDLAAVADLCGLTGEEVIRLHVKEVYRVDFIGFAPGFPYLSELDTRLHVPRLDQPRRQVPVGSVAIAGAQTGIYSRTTAGGWRIIGRTPLAMFDAAQPQPSLLRFGDEVKFVSISVNEMEAWS